MKSKVIQGNNIDTLKQYPDNYFDSIVTDPPYGIDFLQKDWDSNTGAVETWEQCFRVLKPGGHMLAFSAARTYHNLATNIESVGFDIRDQIMWLYASGFPKAQDVGKAIEKREGKRKINTQIDTRPDYSVCPKTICPKCELTGNGRNWENCKETECPQAERFRPANNEWAGWKTALKPAHEPIVMARKPYKGSCVDNVLTHGVGALNIDATRIGEEEMPIGAHEQTPSLFNSNKKSAFADETIQGRFPSNVIGEVTDYQKFFYCPKVNRAERHIGFETDNIPTNPEGLYDIDKGNYIGSKRQTANAQGNNHPTVKPVALMKYLVKLVTPAGGKVLDPFTGSGSTGMAAVELDYDFTGCELDADYVAIANNRITAWKNKTDIKGNKLPEEWFEEE